ncbi:MAG: HigA family addiction module antidote protein [Anaerolineales bacterium]|nr:HigA family addiction module antidote protein [Anaerolineales bacterium]
MSFRMPTHRAPTHPGVILLEEFLEPMGISQKQLADGIMVPYQRINDIIRGRRGITPATALRLVKFFDTTPELWLNLQLRCDLYQSQRDEGPALKSIKPWQAQEQPASAD